MDHLHSAQPGDFTAEDLAAIDRSFGIAANAFEPRRYFVRHLRGVEVVAQFEAVAADSLACATDHPAPEGARCTVMPLAEWREKCAVEADVLYNKQKNSGALERARVAFAHRLDDPLQRGW